MYEFPVLSKCSRAQVWLITVKVFLIKHPNLKFVFLNHSHLFRALSFSNLKNLQIKSWNVSVNWKTYSWTLQKMWFTWWKFIRINFQQRKEENSWKTAFNEAKNKKHKTQQVQRAFRKKNFYFPLSTLLCAFDSIHYEQQRHEKFSGHIKQRRIIQEEFFVITPVNRWMDVRWDSRRNGRETTI